MLTLPTLFDPMKFQNVGTASLVVKITNGSADVFMFAEKVLQEDPLVSSPHGALIEGLLYDISPITHGFDYNSLEYQPSRLSVVISNLWSRVKLDSHVHIRTSDVLVGGDVRGLWGQSLQVIWYPGAYSQGTGDGMMVFDGTIVGIGMDGDERLVLNCDEIWNTKHVMLPQRKATVATFPELPVENIDASLPLVYGPHNEQSYLRNTGFALGLRTAQWKWVIADHVLDSFYDEPRPSSNADGSAYSSSTKACWIFIPELDSWARSYAGVTFDEDDGGRGTVLIDPVAAGFDVYLYPGSAESASSTPDAGNPVGATAAYDYDTTTKFSVVANSTTTASVVFSWYQNGSDSTDPQENGIADMTGPGTFLEGVNLYMSKPGGTTIDSSSIEVWGGASWITVATSIDVATANMIHYGFSGAFDWNTNLHWHLGSGATGGDGTPFKVRLSFVGTGWTANTTVAAYVHECRLVKSCALPKSIIYGAAKAVRRGESVGVPPTWERIRNAIGMPQYINLDSIKQPDILGASCSGREHAHEADHAAEPWNDGDQITNPAGVIESLLVDELGFDTGDDLATDTFDDVYNSGTSRACVLNLRPGSSVHSKQLIDRICYEHGIVLYRRRGNTPQFALVEASGRTTLAATIRRSELWGLPNISFTPFNPTNKITFRYRRIPHDNQYFKSETVEDTVSTAEYGTFEEDIFCQTIANSSLGLNAIKNRLITSNFFRSRPHYIVEFKTVGCRYAALELGDKIQFEAESLDPVLMLYGQSWNGVDFIIYEATVEKNGHSFKAVTSVPEPATVVGAECDFDSVDSVQNIITGYKITLPEDGLIERFDVCMFFDTAVTPDVPPNTHTMKCAIYSYDATPALVSGTETDEVVHVSNTEEEYKDVSFGYTGDKPTLPAGDYYACIWANNVNETTAVRLESASGTGAGTMKKISTYGAWPASLSSPTLDANDTMGMRVHYTPV
jgi:hypothetical protein